MAKSKKNDTSATQVDQVEARPSGLTKDPLAEGNTLVNPTNTEAETHYEVKERSADVQKADSTINGQDANERAEEHNAQSPDASAEAVPNSDTAEQDEVAEGREEAGTVEEQLAAAGPDASENQTTDGPTEADLDV